MANYALANGLRTRGDINISLQNLPAAEEDAKAAAAIFEPFFQRFKDRQENGYLAYSYYGLGQTERALAFFHESRGETAEARSTFESAMTHFSSCSDLKDQVDADGGTRLQNNVSCYCQFWSGKVEEHLQSLPRATKEESDETQSFEPQPINKPDFYCYCVEFCCYLYPLWAATPSARSKQPAINSTFANHQGLWCAHCPTAQRRSFNRGNRRSAQ